MISVIEYHPMPAFSVNIAPGTKVKLENSVSIHSGFLLGDANSFKILGGHVSALYESWEMECKYSGLARMATAKAARIEDDSGPPPFRGLHATRKGNHSSEKKAQAFSKDANDLVKKESVERRSSEALIKSGSQIIHQSSIASSSNQAATSSDPKESGTVNIKDGDIRKDAIEAAMALGVDMAPLQNRAAAQRLLERRTDSNTRTERGRSRGRGRGRRGARHDEEATLTLDEWEAKKALSLGTKAAVVYQGDMDTCNDEVLAQQLHYQLNMDNSKTSNIPGASKEAEQIRLSMFNFANASDDTGHGGHGGRRRGRGHGRRRGRY
ncbi:hypothetical protein KP509_37G069000 [Ceratopteris richardii]|nr:hypothetical protein KP509_37G069000 [Ceratopteris richardii]